MSNYFPLNLLVYLIASYIAILSAEKTAEYCGRRDDIIIPTYNALAATSFRIIFANKLIIFFFANYWIRFYKLCLLYDTFEVDIEGVQILKQNFEPPEILRMYWKLYSLQKFITLFITESYLKNYLDLKAFLNSSIAGEPSLNKIVL